ncbi:hypothetical protein PQX77_005106 [Marasmius sp. AFHP31]|nr:hypothetical protein PQX77_005106 [Marasmius sp. AFHP31]
MRSQGIGKKPLQKIETRRFPWQDEKPETLIPILESAVGLFHIQKPSALLVMSGGLLVRFSEASVALSWDEIGSATINIFDRSAPNDHICLMINTRPISRQELLPYQPYFQAGDRRRGRLTLKSNPRDVSWSAESWKGLERKLDQILGDRRSISQGNEAAVALWTIAKDLTVKTTGAANTPTSPKSQPRSLIRKSPPTRDLPVEEGVERISKKTKLEDSGIGGEEKLKPEEPENRGQSVKEIILTYPYFLGGSAEILAEDLDRLQPLQYLNDNIIEFGLKLWHNEINEQDAIQASQIHIFSTFFYSRLAAEEKINDGCNAVARWTCKVDIFQKKYVFVPINKFSHWFLAVIYRPEFILDSPGASKAGPESSPYIIILDFLGKKHDESIEILWDSLVFEAAQKRENNSGSLTKPIDRTHRTPADRMNDWDTRGVDKSRQQLLDRINQLSNGENARPDTGMTGGRRANLSRAQKK